MSAAMLGWKLDRAQRDALLARFPPRYASPDADHVTFGREDEAPPMPDAPDARIVGRADDGEGVEAMVVELAGSTDRWDGSTWHVTWSLAPGRKAVESNEVIKRCGWQTIEYGPELSLGAGRWE